MALISIIQALALLYVFYLSVMALNKMGPATAHVVRYGHIALTAGSAAGVTSCFAARDIFECILAVGVALFMAGTRRENEK